MVLFSPDLTVIQDSIIKVGDKMARDYMELENLQSSFKGSDKFAITLLDFVKSKLVDHLTDKKPEYPIVFDIDGEATSANDDTDKYIIVLDGRINLFHSVPYFCIAVALQKKGKIVCGVVDNPISQETFAVDEGKGAYVNTRRIRVSQRANPQESIIALTKPDSKYPNAIVTKSSLLNMCYVACGKYEGTVIENPVAIHQLGELLVKESGGLVNKEGDKLRVGNGLQIFG